MNKTYRNFSLGVSLSYIALGLIMYDWTFHMAPSMDGKSNARGVFLDVFLVIFGLIYLTSIFLRERNKVNILSPAILFYIGLMVIFVLGAVVSAIDCSSENIFFHSFAQFLSVTLVLYMPIFALYIFRPKVQAMR